jgi:hypothetical protein
MKYIKIIFTLIVEFIVLYLMFAFSQWSINAYEWGNDLRGMFCALYVILGFFVVMFALMVDGDFEDDY